LEADPTGLCQPHQCSSPLSLWLVGAALGLALAFQSTALFGSPTAACGPQAQFQALLLNGANSKLTPSARMAALEEAVKLCPRNLAAYNGLAVLLLQQQDFERALFWIRRGLRVSPRNPALTLDLGAALLSAGQRHKALQVFKSLPLSAKTEFYLGMTYRALGQHQAARRAMASSFHMGYQDPYVLYLLIEQDRALHDPQAGLRDFKTFDHDFPHSAWLHLLLGEVYDERHDSAHAQTEYEKAASLDPKLPIVHYQLGRIDFTLADYSEAAEEFRREIALNPTFSDAYLYLGAALRRLGKNDAALPYLAQAVARVPNNDLAYTALAAAQIDAHKPKAALATLEAGERRFPKEAAFPAQLSRLLRSMGDLQGAREQASLTESLSRANNPELHVASPLRNTPAGTLQSSSLRRLAQCVQQEDVQCASSVLSQPKGASLQENPEYLNLKAQTLDLERHSKQALAAIQRAIEIDPHRADFLVTRGRIDQRIGNQRAAIESFLDAEQMQPGSEAPIYYLGMSFFIVGYAENDNTDYDRAAQNFKAAIELDPHDDRAEFMLGVVDSIEFKVAEAKKYLEEAVKMKPNNPYYHLHYGMLLSRTGHLAEGQREMELAEKLDPSYSPTYVHLGDVEAQMGEYEQARAQLETALRLDPHLASAYYTLGSVYYRLGLKVKSHEAFREFQEMKSPEQKGKNPIGASSNAVIPWTERQ
jgi:tetratricopeptide (TPR) repeat protein